MVHQSSPFTKLPCFSRLFKRTAKVLTISAVVAAMLAAPESHAIVKMTDETVNLAILHGIRHQDASYAGLLGPNWVEGPNGALLNVYSPFMVLASKAAAGKFPRNPSDEDMQEARNRYAKYVTHYTDPKFRMQVKFAVSMYGDTPQFGGTYKARIEGFGRGKSFEIKPYRVIYDKIADQIATEGAYTHEAINSYYFLYKDIKDLQDFRLILESPYGPPVVFKMHNDELY